MKSIQMMLLRKSSSKSDQFYLKTYGPGCMLFKSWVEKKNVDEEKLRLSWKPVYAEWRGCCLPSKEIEPAFDI